MVSRGQLSRKSGTLRHRAWVWFYLIACLSSSANAELSLSPQRQEYELEGVPKWCLIFETGTSVKAKYAPPKGWDYSGSPDRLNLRPPGVSQAEANITRFKMEEFPPCNDEGGSRLAELTLSALPEGAQEAKVESTTANPLQIGGKDTYLVHLTYTFYGERLSRYCLYLLANDGPMRFQLTCRTSDYPKLSAAFQKSLFSWQNL